MALDFYEERKWKKASCFIFSRYCAQEVKTKEENKKLDSLYVKCLNLNSSLKDTKNTSSISLSNDNKNKGQLIFICKKDNEYIINEIAKWKICINELENKLKEAKSQKIEKFLRILNEIGNIIKNQEENIKRIDNDEKKRQELKNETKSFSLSEYALQLQTTLGSAITNSSPGFGQDSRLDFKNLHKKITSLLDEITGEIYQSIDTTINNKNSKHKNTINENPNKKLNIENNQDLNMINPNNNIKNFNSNNIISNSIEKRRADIKNIENKNLEEITNELIGNNISTIIFNINDDYSSEEILDFLGEIHNTDKFEQLPSYDYKKIQNEKIDLNSIKLNFENVYFKTFPSVYFNDNSSRNKKLIEKDIIALKSQTKKKKSPDSEQNDIYSKLTPLQKLVLIWGISLYGKNEFILNDICNSFSFTKNINLDNEDIEFIIEKILEEINVDMLASNFNSLVSKTFRNIPINIESPIHITTTSRFNYNYQLKDFFSGKIKTLTDSKEIEKKYKLIKYSFGSIEKRNNQNNENIHFIYNNPFFENYYMKRKFSYAIMEQMKKLCDQINEISEKNVSQYDYYQMKEIPKLESAKNNLNHKKKVNDIKSYENIRKAKNKKLNREEVLKDLESSKQQIDVKKITDNVLDEQNNDCKNIGRPKIMEVLSFFCYETIEKEWKQLRATWYQNNSKFNPKYRKGKFEVNQQIQNRMQQNNKK